MKPAPFRYHAAHSVAEAVALLGEFGDEAKVLAGGQSLVPAMNFRLARPAALVDVNPVPGLDYVTEENGSLRIGALVRHATLEQPVTGGPVGRLLSLAARYVGHLPIRIRGTFGGSLAHADPAAEWCMLALLLDAEMVAAGPSGRRTIPAAEFFHTVFTTALEPEELLVEARLPLLPPGAGVGFEQFSRRAGDFALAMVGTAVEVAGGRVRSARIALGGVSDRPVRTPEAEQALVGEPAAEESFRAAAEVAAGEFYAIGDIHGSAGYRRDLVRALTRRALVQAIAA